MGKSRLQTLDSVLKEALPLDGKRSPEAQTQVDRSHARRAAERRELLRLTRENIAEIQRAFDNGESTWRELAERFGVCFTDVDRITSDSLEGAIAYCKREGSK